tara:strand:- start:193 stop:984 length:792 start_codon:yes stop_codon:yes gene_type:complete
MRRSHRKTENALAQLKNFPFGIFLGICFALLLSWLFDSDIKEEMTKFYTFVFTAVISLLASTLAVVGVLLNLNKQQELIERRHIAARAVLPLTLSRLYGLTERAFEITLDTTALRKRPEDVRRNLLKKLRLTKDDIEQLRDCIEASDEQSQAWIALIIAHWQLEISRLENRLLDQNLLFLDSQLHNSAIDWLTIRGMAIHLFEYSRTGKKPDNKISADIICLPIHSPYLHTQSLEEAREKKLAYFQNNGGLTFSGFSARLENQ